MKRRSQTCISLLNPYLAKAESLGWERRVLLEKLGMQESLFEHAMTRIAFRDFLAAVHQLIEITQEPALGLLAGTHFHPSTLGPLAYLMMNSPTAGEAYRNFLVYEPLINEAVTTRLEDKGEFHHNYEEYRGYSDAEVAPIVEADFSSLIAYMQFLSFRPTTEQPAAKKILFRHAALTDVARYEEIFSTSVEFEQSHNAVIFDSAAMNYPIPGADERIVARAITELDSIQLAMKGERRFSSDVYDFIKEGFYGELPSAVDAAKSFAMSASTLQRRLKEESNTFKGLVEKVRKDKAEVFLADIRLSLAEVALRLGFSDTSAFFKAFKRWTGKTPAEYRKDVANVSNNDVNDK